MIGGIEEMFPNIKVEANATKPRRQAFNVTLNGELLWDGKALGPPRAKKFEILLGKNLHDTIMINVEQKKNYKNHPDLVDIC